MTTIDSRRRGITLIDTLVGIGVMAIVFVGVASAFQLSVKIVTNNKARAGAIALADQPLAAQQFVAMLKTELHMKAVLGLQAEFSTAERRRVVDAAVEVFMTAFASRRR